MKLIRKVTIIASYQEFLSKAGPLRVRACAWIVIVIFSLCNLSKGARQYTKSTWSMLSIWPAPNCAWCGLDIWFRQYEIYMMWTSFHYACHCALWVLLWHMYAFSTLDLTPSRILIMSPDYSQSKWVSHYETKFWLSVSFYNVMMWYDQYSLIEISWLKS